MVHGYVAYRSGKCRCAEKCRPAHNRRRREERAGVKQASMRLDGDRLFVKRPLHLTILRAFAKDGADVRTVARRAHCGATTVNEVINDSMRTLGYTTRSQVAVALATHYVTATIEPTKEERP